MALSPTLKNKIKKALALVRGYRSTQKRQRAETVGGKPVTRIRLDGLKKKKKEIVDEIARKKADLGSLETQLRDATGGGRDTDIQKQQHETIRQQLEDEISELEEKAKKLEEDLRQTKAQIEQDKSKISSENLRLQEFESQAGAKGEKVESIEAQKEKLEKDIEGEERELQEVRSEETEVERVLSELDRKGRMGGASTGQTPEKIRQDLMSAQNELQREIDRSKRAQRRLHNVKAGVGGGESPAELRSKEMEINRKLAVVSQKVGSMATSPAEKEAAKREMADLEKQRDEVKKGMDAARRRERSVERGFNPKDLQEAQKLMRELKEGVEETRRLEQEKDFEGLRLQRTV